MLSLHVFVDYEAKKERIMTHDFQSPKSNLTEMLIYSPSAFIKNIKTCHHLMIDCQTKLYDDMSTFVIMVWSKFVGLSNSFMNMITR